MASTAKPRKRYLQLQILTGDDGRHHLVRMASDGTTEIWLWDRGKWEPLQRIHAPGSD
jgi:hypothetical protein